MEIICPSCGKAHNTREHAGAFEIHCQCGYAILMPDEEALAKESQASESASFGPGFGEHLPVAGEDSKSDAPSAVNDKNLPTKSPDELSKMHEWGHEQTQSIPLLHGQLTPPSQLPEEMPYDPFELEHLSPVSDITSVDNPESSTENTSQFEPQKIIERLQNRTLGQYLGPAYHLQCLELDERKLNELMRRCQHMLKGRRWLESELANRNIDLSKPNSFSDLHQVPELMAVEIYAHCIALGGKCKLSLEP